MAQSPVRTWSDDSLYTADSWLLVSCWRRQTEFLNVPQWIRRRVRVVSLVEILLNTTYHPPIIRSWTLNLNLKSITTVTKPGSPEPWGTCSSDRRHRRCWDTRPGREATCWRPDLRFHFGCGGRPAHLSECTTQGTTQAETRTGQCHHQTCNHTRHLSKV